MPFRCSDLLLEQLHNLTDADLSLGVAVHEARGFLLGVERLIPLGGIGRRIHNVDHECELLHQGTLLPRKPTGQLQGCSQVGTAPARPRALGRRKTSKVANLGPLP